MSNQENSELIELLAAEAHKVYSEQLTFMFQQGFISGTGDWVMMPSARNRWHKLKVTAYNRLPSNVIWGHRAIANRYLAIMQAQTCEWTQFTSLSPDWSVSTYKTECGGVYYSAGDAEVNGRVYCTYCGKTIKGYFPQK